jgi:NADPH:quinone reductase-like Zn-dependent oxidoreductase
MKAVRIHAFGGPEVLTLEEAPTPAPGADDVLVRILAAGVNPVDYKFRAGGMLRPENLPVILGGDIAGVIERLGPQVMGFTEGEAVYALLPGLRGGYAELAAVPAQDCAVKPQRLSFVQAAAAPMAALTAWQALFDLGDLKEGQRALVHGAAGGVGNFAVQLAKARGATVIATCSRDDFDFVRRLGATEVIDYRGERFEEQVANLDLVLDTQGGETRERSWGVLKAGGILVSTQGAPSNEEAVRRSVRAAGVSVRPNGAQLAQIGRLIDLGQVTLHIDRTYPLSAAADAHARLEHEHVRGKIVLQVAQERSA